MAARPATWTQSDQAVVEAYMASLFCVAELMLGVVSPVNIKVPRLEMRSVAVGRLRGLTRGQEIRCYRFVG